MNNSRELRLYDKGIILFCILFYINIDKENFIDRSLSIAVLCINAIYILGRITNKRHYISYHHFFQAVITIAIPLFSTDKDLLLLTTILIIMVISTRKIFGRCIVRALEDRDAVLVNNRLTHSLNWDIIYPSIGIISLIKIYYYHLV